MTEAVAQEIAYELVHTGEGKDDPDRTFSAEGMSKLGRLIARFIGGAVMGRLIMGRGPKWVRVTVKVEFEPDQAPQIKVVKVVDGYHRHEASG